MATIGGKLIYVASARRRCRHEFDENRTKEEVVDRPYAMVRRKDVTKTDRRTSTDNARGCVRCIKGGGDICGSPKGKVPAGYDNKA